MAGLAGSFSLFGGLSMRLTTPTDEAFLFQLFIDVRPWLAWAEGDTDFIRTLYESQYKVMRTGQETVYPEHLDFIIEKTDQRVGRLVIDLGYADWRVSELQIISQAQGQGIGSDLLRSLQQAAGNSRMPITLSTPMYWFSALQFYERLGFRVMATDPPYYHMAWFPPGHPMAV